jgi:hypothetical protein
MQGIASNTGATGDQGPAGEKGDQGLKGDQGPMGEKGEQGFTGEKGDQGPVGPAGTNGSNGTTGMTGSTGATGPVGTNGLKGDQGLTGATGSQGATGATGSSGASQLGVANTWTALQNFSSGLTVSSGAVSFPASSISSSCISGGGGGASLSTANTWTALQTFNSGIGLPTTISTGIPVNQIGYTVSVGPASGQLGGGGQANFIFLSLGPNNSVWSVNYVITLSSSHSITDSSSRIFIGSAFSTNAPSTGVTYGGINRFYTGQVPNGNFSGCQTVVVTSEGTATNNIQVMGHLNITACAYSNLYMWATRIA